MMATSKKTAETAAESVQEVEKTAEVSQTQEAAEAAHESASASPVEQESPNAPESVQDGIDIKDTPLGDVEGDLVVVDSPTGLYLRNGPAKSFPVLEILKNCSVVIALALPYGAEVPGWALVHTGQRIGWVDISYLQALEE